METINGIRGDARAEWLTSNRDAAKILDTYIDQAEQDLEILIQIVNEVLSREVLCLFLADVAGNGSRNKLQIVATDLW